MEREFERLAMDLRASPTQAFTRVGLPLLAPAVVSAVAIAFLPTFHNLVLSQWLGVLRGVARGRRWSTRRE